MDRKDEYVSVRVKRSTKETLSELMEAYSVCYGKPFTFDAVVNQMVASIEEGDVAVWERSGRRWSGKRRKSRKGGSDGECARKGD